MTTTSQHLLTYVVEGQAQKEVTLNTDLAQIDAGLSGYLAKSVAGGTNVTLTATEWNNRIFEFTGLLTGNIAVIVPATTRFFVAYNNTSGAFTLTVRTSGGSGIAVTQGLKAVLYSNGTDVFKAQTMDVPSGTIVGTSDTQTLTNKRITPRVQSIADATSLTINVDSYDAGVQVNTQGSGTLTFNAPSGTPTDFQLYRLRVKLTNTQTGSFNAIFRGSGDIALPTTMAAGTHYLGFSYNSTDTKYDLVAYVKTF